MLCAITLCKMPYILVCMALTYSEYHGRLNGKLVKIPIPLYRIRLSLSYIIKCKSGITAATLVLAVTFLMRLSQLTRRVT